MRGYRCHPVGDVIGNDSSAASRGEPDGTGEDDHHLGKGPVGHQGSRRLPYRERALPARARSGFVAARSDRRCLSLTAVLASEGLWSIAAPEPET